MRYLIIALLLSSCAHIVPNEQNQKLIKENQALRMKIKKLKSEINEAKDNPMENIF